LDEQIRHGDTEVVGRETFLELLDRLPQAVLLLDANGRIRHWSAGATALFGYPASEMVGHDVERLLSPLRSTAGETARLLAHARAGGEMHDLETDRLTRDGRVLTVLLTQTPTRSADGSHQGVLQVLTDITEHRRLLRQLERRVHQLSIVKEIGEALHGTMDVDEVLHLILVGATAGPGLRFNRAFLLLADETGSRLEGRLAIGPSDGGEAQRIWHELSQQPMTLRQMLSRYGGSLAETNRPLNELVRGLSLPLEEPGPLLAKAISSARAVVLPASEPAEADRALAERLGAPSFALATLSARGRVIGALLADNAITGRDIQPEDLEMLQLLAATASIAIDNSRLYAELARRLSHLEAAQDEARRSQRAVRRAERLSAIGEMAATVAHDIRNPLVAIGGFARALLADTSPGTPQRGPLEVIVEEVDRLEGIVTKVLDEARPVSPAGRAVQMNRLLEEAAKLLDRELQDARIAVRLQLDPGVPSIVADSDRLFELVLNLVRNAIEAMPDGGTLTIATLPLADRVEIRFGDTGTGIPDAIRERIFSPFFTTKPDGSGLGLSVARQVVLEHGGTIGVDSVVGSGSTFTVTLPTGIEADHGQAARG
jgi:PAS domain S-box-containing protein